MDRSGGICRTRFRRPLTASRDSKARDRELEIVRSRLRLSTALSMHLVQVCVRLPVCKMLSFVGLYSRAVSVLRAGALAHGTIPRVTMLVVWSFVWTNPCRVSLLWPARPAFCSTRSGFLRSVAVNRAASLWGERASRNMTFLISHERSLAITRESELVTFHSPSMETRMVTVRRVWNGDWSRFQVFFGVSPKNPTWL